MDKIIGIFSFIIVLAIIAVLVSSKANTPSVITAAATGFANDIKAAVSPIS